MSCQACNCNPCQCEPCDPNNEPLASALNNFITAFFGSVTKTCVNGQVVWALPCDLEAGCDDFPRLPGEGIACYFMRFFCSAMADYTAGKGCALAGQVFQPGVAQAVVWDTTQFATIGMFDPATPTRLTIPVAEVQRNGRG